jgi:hypothetical protein
VLDPTANPAPDSRIGLYIVPTDEELMIARHTLALLAARATQPVQAGAGQGRRVGHPPTCGRPPRLRG